MDARKRAYVGNPGPRAGSPQRGPRDASVAGCPSRGRTEGKCLRFTGPLRRCYKKHKLGEGATMKIVGFEANGALHLGVVEGDQVIDLQAVDKAIPGDLGECLRRNNGELSALKDAA